MISKISAHERKVDRNEFIASKIIMLGAGLTIFSIIAMMVFIFSEIVPLIQDPSVGLSGKWDLRQDGAPLSIGLDEYRETAYIARDSGKIDFVSLENGGLLESIEVPEWKGKTITSTFTTGKRNIIFFGTSDGEAGYMEVVFRPEYSSEGRIIRHSIEKGAMWEVNEQGKPVSLLAGTINEDGAVIMSAVVKNKLSVIFFDPEMDETEIVVEDTGRNDFSSITITSTGEEIAVGTSDGEILILKAEEGEVEHYETFRASSSGGISSLIYLTGDGALLSGDESGNINEWFSVRHVIIKNNSHGQITLEGVGFMDAGEERKLIDRGYGEKLRFQKDLSILPAKMKYLKVRSFTPHESPVTSIAASSRNKGFLSTSKNGKVAYHYSTSGETFFELDLKDGLEGIVFAPKSNGLMALTENGVLHDYGMDEKHPGVTLKTLFGSIWYEGYPGSEYVWQSTGGTDDFESKFSMWPLIFGTFKGTLYAMFFSVPISIMGALYLSQLAPAGLRNIVKPIIEIMAAIPSVVVGFLAGLWLAPVIDKNLLSFFLIVLSIPAGWFFLVCIVWALPERIRPDISGTKELLCLFSAVLIGMLIAAKMGPLIETAFFGGDLKAWLYQSMGILYDTRNSMVVGFALGFAVIPIIFTISEDALFSVPPALTSTAYALAASRWQTAIYVVLPAASPGIFAATMLGLGRAVGETMIVLMATGNVPIIDLSIFNGFRAMSAAIAVEISEAPVGGSLYSILFLTGFILFTFTFVINTLSSVISTRLRWKYSRF